jgi:hypothetical protein
MMFVRDERCTVSFTLALVGSGAHPGGGAGVGEGEGETRRLACDGVVDAPLPPLERIARAARQPRRIHLVTVHADSVSEHVTKASQ